MQEKYYTDLLQFIISHGKNWINEISKAPYYITAKQCPFKDKLGNLLYPKAYMLSYSQFESDFTNRVVKACRGSIVDVSIHNDPKMICVPFYKFVNHGQDGEDVIDWSTARVLDKIDGMLIKCWYSMKLNRWVWVTNNGWNIDCKLPETLLSQYKEPESEKAETFYDLLNIAFDHANLTKNWYEKLDKDYTYLFELVSPKTRIICDYPKTELYYLGKRNVETWIEINPEEESEKLLCDNFKHPELYLDKTLEDVLYRCNNYNNVEKEGVVVCDNDFHRFKIKCNEYLKIKFAKNQLEIGEDFLLKCIREESEDDLLSLFPELKEKLDEIKTKLINFKNNILSITDSSKKLYSVYEKEARRKYAESIKNESSIKKQIMFLAITDDESIERFINNSDFDYINKFLEKE